MIGSRQRSQILDKPSSSSRKRKREQEEPEVGNQEERERGYQENQEGVNQEEQEPRNQEQVEEEEEGQGASQEEQEGERQLEHKGEDQEEQAGGHQEKPQREDQEKLQGEDRAKQQGEDQEEQGGGYQEKQDAGNQETRDADFQENQGAKHISPRIRVQSSFKQPSISPPGLTTATVPGTTEEKWEKKSLSDTRVNIADPIEYWILTERWPEVYFESHGQTWQDLESDSSLEEKMESPNPSVQWFNFNGFILPRPLPRVQTIRRKQSGSNLTETCDQTNREKKSIPYANPQYAVLLEAKGSYMYKSASGVTKESKGLCQHLLESPQAVLEDSLFRDDLFETTCCKIENRNEAKVVQDIARLLVPSVETFATYGATHLEHLIEGVNEAWLGNIPIQGPRPQPDYFVGFRRSAFTAAQLKKIDPLIGSPFETSFYIATFRIYFPFFACEVKCGMSGLDIADRQNAHSMSVALRALVVLFKSVGREKELDRKILTFSVSHDHRSVRIYGHYIVFEEDKVLFYRHSIHAFDFTALDGKEKWITYKFTKSIYDHYAPKIHELICSAIDDLPTDISFDLSQSASFTQSGSDVGSVRGKDESQSSFTTPPKAVTPTTSFGQAMEPASKKPKNN